MNFSSVYRFRSAKSIFEHKELENQEVYFSSIEELNDPIEEYKNYLFNADKIYSTNFLRIYFLNIFIYHNYKSTNVINFKLQNSSFLTYDDKLEKFLSHDIINKINCILSSNSDITEQELKYYFTEFITSIAYCIVKDITYDENSINENSKIIDGIIKIKNKIKTLNSFDNNSELKDMYDKFAMNKKSPLKKYLENYIDYLNFTNDYFEKIKHLCFPKTRISCFSATYTSVLMWSHYADSHKGICLIFKTRIHKNSQFIKLHDLNFKIQSNEDIYTLGDNLLGVRKHDFIKVKYKKILSDFPSTNFATSHGMLTPEESKEFYKDSNGNDSKVIHEIYRENPEWINKYWQIYFESISTKLEPWSYEQELRLIEDNILDRNKFDNIENRKKKFIIDDLEGIIFGIKTSDNDKKKIINIIESKKSNCKFYQSFISYTNKNIIDKFELKK
ncbi:DUF2971 domain-containing protein [Fluviispira sanaruensis]|uniref:DUF2971 domain-containing protein n=1 Tax=Fluviispira sanaruensis TaxID=2493639 RepID=A0A4P2VKG2_FLUSA|nr:DUF2971 domain-containing protein [Fluviispira sanaruensis]BBH53736.1 DUF2971 domain-containing protein [Fluviispira sanaruensis]